LIRRREGGAEKLVAAKLYDVLGARPTDEGFQ